VVHGGKGLLADTNTQNILLGSAGKGNREHEDDIPRATERESPFKD